MTAAIPPAKAASAATASASAVPAPTAPGDAGDGRLVNPSAERNKHVVRQILECYLPPPNAAAGCALEVSSGTGQHMALFSRVWPHVMWRPTEYDAKALPSIDAYRLARAAELGISATSQAASGSGGGAGGAAACPKAEDEERSNNFEDPFVLDVCSAADLAKVEAHAFDLCFNVNMLHISPPEALNGLMRCAAHALTSHGVLMTYGPYNVVDDTFSTPSNARFDSEYVKKLNPAFGIRNLSAVKRAAAAHGLRFVRAHAVPSNNFVLAFVRNTTPDTTKAAAVAAGAVAAVTAVATFVVSAAANDAGSGAGIAVRDAAKDAKDSTPKPAPAAAAATAAAGESLVGDDSGHTSLGVALPAAVKAAEAVSAELLKAEADAKAKAAAEAS